MSPTKTTTHIWKDSDGKPVACTEKLKVLTENIEELKQVAKDAFDDGVLMGVDPQQLRECFADLMLQLKDM